MKRGNQEKRYCCADHKADWNKQARILGADMERLGIIKLREYAERRKIPPYTAQDKSNGQN